MVSPSMTSTVGAVPRYGSTSVTTVTRRVGRRQPPTLDRVKRRMRTVDNQPPARGGGFLRWIELNQDIPSGGYPYALPVVAALREAQRWHLDPAVTFLVGDNGTGKSTLVEAIAVAAGFNPEGGSSNFRFTTRATESPLGEYLQLIRGSRKPSTGFFLRAESFYNVATEIEKLEGVDPGLIESSYGDARPTNAPTASRSWPWRCTGSGRRGCTCSTNRSRRCRSTEAWPCCDGWPTW
jgi:hypothetical protein